jgi:hypothetical protein
MGMGMTALMAFGALGIGISIDSVVRLVELGVTTQMLTRLSASLCMLIAVVTFTLVGLRRVGRKLDNGDQRASRKVWSRLGFN